MACTRKLLVHALVVIFFAVPVCLFVIVAGSATTTTTLAQGASSQNSASSQSSSSIPTNLFTVDVTDNVESAQPGAILTYRILVHNTASFVATTDVSMLVPQDLSLQATSPDASVIDDDAVLWRQVPFQAGEQHLFTVRAEVPRSANAGRTFGVVVRAGNASDQDETTVVSRNIAQAIDLSMEGDVPEVRSGGFVTYTIRARNVSGRHLDRMYITALIPSYSFFVNATEGGDYDGHTIRWNDRDFDANEVITFSFTVRIQDDAPLGRAIRAEAASASDRVYAQTIIVRTIQDSSRARSSRSRVAQRQSSDMYDPMYASSSAMSETYQTGDAMPPVTHVSRSVSSAPTYTLLTKAANADEVLPGGNIRYTITVQNLLLGVMRHAAVIDQYNPAEIEIVDGKGAQVVGSGQLLWEVPTLNPGEIWQVTYTARARESLPHGGVISTIASLTGEDVVDAPANERVRVYRITVVSSLPPTGAPLDLLFIAPVSLIGGLCAALQRRARRRVLA